MATAMACVEKVDAKSSLSKERLDLALKEKNEGIDLRTSRLKLKKFAGWAPGL